MGIYRIGILCDKFHYVLYVSLAFVTVTFDLDSALYVMFSHDNCYQV